MHEASSSTPSFAIPTTGVALKFNKAGLAAFLQQKCAAQPKLQIKRLKLLQIQAAAGIPCPSLLKAPDDSVSPAMSKLCQPAGLLYLQLIDTWLRLFKARVPKVYRGASILTRLTSAVR